MDDSFEKWTELAGKWMYYIPPGRPSRGDIDCFREIIKSFFGNSKNLNALVLGATPEFRDLLSELGATVSLIDKNPYMVSAMNFLRVYQNPEAVIIDDWFEALPKHTRKYDLILSDFTQGNIPYAKQKTFYKLIAGALMPGGLFIDRVLTYRDPNRLYNADKEFDDFAACPINLLHINDMFYKCFFASNWVYKWKRVNLKKTYFLMKKKKNPVISKYADIMEKLMGSGEIIWYYGKDWAEIKKSYFCHLQLIKEVPHTGTVYEDFVFIIASTAKLKEEKT